ISLYISLKTEDAMKASYAVKQNDIIFVFTSPLIEHEDTQEMFRSLKSRGDAISDVAYNVDSLEGIEENGIDGIMKVWSESDKHGMVKYATLKSPFGDLTHTLIERNEYPLEH